VNAKTYNSAIIIANLYVFCGNIYNPAIIIAGLYVFYIGKVVRCIQIDIILQECAGNKTVDLEYG